jgi:hypothetical protein
MKPIYFSAIAKFNVHYDELNQEQQEYLEERLNKKLEEVIFR